MKKFLIFFAILFLFASATFAQQKFTHTSANDETTIRSVLEEQRLAWNRGDINHFMGTYWKSDSLMFIGKSGVTYGWQKTMDNYNKNYPDTAAMGHLDFTILEVKRLSLMYFFVVGQWHLTRSIGDIGGHFTLLFKKIKNKWMIVADHSS